jgi:hypothetical protein
VLERKDNCQLLDIELSLEISTLTFVNLVSAAGSVKAAAIPILISSAN